MAGRLKENMKIDPLTIDQTMFIEKSDTTYNHLFIKHNNSQDPIVLIDNNNKIFNGFNGYKQTDIVVIHPKTTYINKRPIWNIKDKKKYKIPKTKTNKNLPILILAYRNNEIENNGIPADIIEITNNKKARILYLNDGNYTIVIKDKNYNIIDKYNIIIK